MSAKRNPRWSFWIFPASALAMIIAVILPDPINTYVLVAAGLTLCGALLLMIIRMQTVSAAWERHHEQHLVACGDCGTRISKQARQCPHCGAPNTHRGQANSRSTE